MEYFIKFSAILGLFYIFYKLFLENETFFNSIRVYFILGVITALVAPLIVIPEYVYIEDLFAGQTITASVAETASSESGQVDLMTILLTLYGAGTIFFAIRFLMQLAQKENRTLYLYFDRRVDQPLFILQLYHLSEQRI